MSDGKWTNEMLAEYEVNEKVRWVLSESTSPEGKKLLGVRKFVTTKAGVKPTAQGISFADKDEMAGVIDLLQKALKPARPDYIIKFQGDAGPRFVLWADGRKFTKKRENAKRFASRAEAEAFREKFGKSTWLILKARPA